MKKLLPFVMIICLLLSSCQLKNDFTPQEITTSEEMRGVWISCYDHISAQGKTEDEYRKEIDSMFRTISDCGLNTAFVHLRAFSDAFYESEIFPYSSLIAGTQGASLPFDPFRIMLECAKKYEISVHGWINPFRISGKSDVSSISNNNPAKALLESKNGEVCILPNGIYYNPACESNHKLILDGVREIIDKYDIDGIHIDDYFYPAKDDVIDKIQYDEYLSQGGKLSLSEWRIIKVNSFVSALYSAVKSADKNLIVSISPAAEIEKNKNELYADCELWLSSEGYADMIIPQIYYGFNHDTLPFRKTLDKWGNLERHSSVTLACGIAAYKCDETYNYSDKNESIDWMSRDNNLAMQVTKTRENNNFRGFVVFSYQNLISESCSKEISNLVKTITET